jgi:hypothetical protein
MEFSTGRPCASGGDVQEAALVLCGSTFVILLASDQRLLRHRCRAHRSPEPSIIGTVINLALGTLLAWVRRHFPAAHDNPDTADLSLLWHPRPFWKYLGASILRSPSPSIVLLIVPGIILGLMFMFTTFVVIERELVPSMR